MNHKHAAELLIYYKVLISKSTFINLDLHRIITVYELLNKTENVIKIEKQESFATSLKLPAKTNSLLDLAHKWKWEVSWAKT